MGSQAGEESPSLAGTRPGALGRWRRALARLGQVPKGSARLSRASAPAPAAERGRGPLRGLVNLCPFSFNPPSVVFLFRTRGDVNHLKFINTVKFYCISGPQDLYPGGGAGGQADSGSPSDSPRPTRGFSDTRLRPRAGGNRAAELRIFRRPST